MHATAVVLGAAGVLIRGPSGAGKTTSALALIDDWSAKDRFAALIADDRVVLQACAGRLIAHAPAALAGLVEARGIGILAVDHAPATVLRLVIDLVPGPDVPRLPDAAERVAELLGVIVPRLAASPGPSLATLVRLALQEIRQSRDISDRACLCSAT